MDSYRDRTPPTVRRIWEDFQRAGFSTSVEFSPHSNPSIAHNATIWNDKGNVAGAGESADAAIAVAVSHANEKWPITL
jgi:hypothetical protein